MTNSERILSILKRRKNGATVTELLAKTGIPAGSLRKTLHRMYFRFEVGRQPEGRTNRYYAFPTGTMNLKVRM